MAKAFYIQNAATKLVLTVQHDRAAPGAHVIMQPFIGKNSQLWSLVNDTIFSKSNPSMALDLEGKKGPNVIMFPGNGLQQQQWKFNTDGTVGNAKEKLVLDVSGGSTSSGAQVIVWKKTKGPNQIFKQIPI